MGSTAVGASRTWLLGPRAILPGEYPQACQTCRYLQAHLQPGLCVAFSSHSFFSTRSVPIFCGLFEFLHGPAVDSVTGIDV